MLVAQRCRRCCSLCRVPKVGGKGEEEKDEIWKKLLMQCGAKLTSPGLSVQSGALVLVLACVHHVLLFLIVEAVVLGKAEHLIT